MASKKDPTVQEIMVSTVPVMTEILTGAIWEKSEEEIAQAQKSLSNVLQGLKNVAKVFDENLVNLRKTNPDALKSVEHFRKPRESKEKEISVEAMFGL